MEKKVKGTFFIDYVRMIKGKKDADWNEYLTEGDMKFLSGKIVDSEWYPFDTFERMGVGILKEVAHGEMDAVRYFGRTYIDRLMSVHQSLIAENDPKESLVRFQVVRRSFFNFDPIEILVFFKNHAKFKIKFGMSPDAEQAATYQTLGYFEKLLELSGAQDVASKFTSRAWEGQKDTILEMDWSEVAAGDQVKGAIFIDYLKMIKKRMDLPWSDHLMPRDMVYLNQRIEDNQWYPFDTYERMGLAIFHEIAGDDMDLVRKWGNLSMENLFKLHGSLVAPFDPRESLMRFHVLRRSLFTFEAIKIVSLLGNSAKFQIGYRMSRAAEEAACYQTLGFFEKLLQQAGARNIKAAFSEKSWEGDAATILNLEWDDPDQKQLSIHRQL